MFRKQKKDVIERKDIKRVVTLSCPCCDEPIKLEINIFDFATSDMIELQGIKVKWGKAMNDNHSGGE